MRTEPFPDLAAAVRAALSLRGLGTKTRLAAAARVSRSRLSLIRRGKYPTSPKVALALVRQFRAWARSCDWRADAISAVLDGSNLDVPNANSSQQER